MNILKKCNALSITFLLIGASITTPAIAVDPFSSPVEGNDWNALKGSYQHKTWTLNKTKIFDKNAIDLNRNTPIWDADDGVDVRPVTYGQVVYVDKDNKGFVIIRHSSPNNNFYSGYMHMDGISVYEGQHVNSSTVIGEVSNLGVDLPSVFSGPNHLHFGLYIGTYFENMASRLRSVDLETSGFSFAEGYTFK